MLKCWHADSLLKRAGLAVTREAAAPMRLKWLCTNQLIVHWVARQSISSQYHRAAHRAQDWRTFTSQSRFCLDWPTSWRSSSPSSAPCRWRGRASSPRPRPSILGLLQPGGRQESGFWASVGLNIYGISADGRWTEVNDWKLLIFSLLLNDVHEWDEISQLKPVFRPNHTTFFSWGWIHRCRVNTMMVSNLFNIVSENYWIYSINNLLRKYCFRL